MTHQFTHHIGTFRKKKIDCPDALEVVLVIGYWILRFIWNLVLVIWDFKEMGTGQIIRTPFSLTLWLLEQSTHFTGFNINIHPPEGRVGAGTGHQTDGAGAGAQELGAGINQHVADRQGPALGNTL